MSIDKSGDREKPAPDSYSIEQFNAMLRAEKRGLN
jgi:hypothetical protein